MRLSKQLRDAIEFRLITAQQEAQHVGLQEPCHAILAEFLESVVCGLDLAEFVRAKCEGKG